MRWGLGVISAVRPVPTVQGTINSIRNAWGYSDQIYVFQEPDCSLLDFRDDDGIAVIRRPNGSSEVNGIVPSPEGRFGNFQNWVQAAADLLDLEPDAEAFLICEDDALINVTSRDVVEGRLWPADDCGVVSLYCATRKSLQRRQPALTKPLEPGLFGCVAAVYPRMVLEALVTDPDVATFAGSVNQRNPRPWERKAVDTWIGKRLGEYGLSVWVFSPSLACHSIPPGMKENSSLQHGQHTMGRKEWKWVGLTNDATGVYAPSERFSLEKMNQWLKERIDASHRQNPE